MIWGNDMIMKLLELVKENITHLQQKNSHQKHIWYQISKELQESVGILLCLFFKLITLKNTGFWDGLQN